MTQNIHQYLRNLDHDWKSMMLGVWEQTNDYVHSRENIVGMLERGEISKEDGERMMRIRYEVNRRGELVVRDHEDYER